MNKICTSIEQSKKLIELGIDVNTADMHYAFTMIGGDAFQEMIDNLAILLPDKKNTKYPYEPAWSLSALLELMPRYIYHPDKSHCNYLNICKTKNLGWLIDYSNIALDEVVKEIASEKIIDSAFEMVCWLKENGKI